MKNKDNRAAALAEYRRLRPLAAREVADVMQTMRGDKAFESAAHRLYNGVTPREGYKESLRICRAVAMHRRNFIDVIIDVRN